MSKKDLAYAENSTLSEQQKHIKAVIDQDRARSSIILKTECTHPFICVHAPGERIEHRVSAYGLPWIEYRICPFCGDCETVMRDPNIVRRTNDEMCRKKFATRDHVPIRKINEEEFLNILSAHGISRAEKRPEKIVWQQEPHLRSLIEEYNTTLLGIQKLCAHDHVYAYKQDDMLHRMGVSTSEHRICPSCGLEEVLKGSSSRTRRIIEKTISILSKKNPDREITEEELHRIREHFSPIPCRI